MAQIVEPLTLAKGTSLATASTDQLVFLLLSFSDIKRSIELLEKLQKSGEVPATKLAALQKVWFVT